MMAERQTGDIRASRVALSKRLFLLVSVLLLLTACRDPEYTNVRVETFPPQYQRYDRLPWEMLDLQEFSAIYTKILADFPSDQYLDDFVSELGVVATHNRFITTDQGDFVYMQGCKPHCCGSAQLFVLFDPKNMQVWAEAIDLGVLGHYDVWLGHPAPEVKRLFETVRLKL